MSKLHDVVEETLIAYGGKSFINVMMFGCDEETEQMINNCPSAYINFSIADFSLFQTSVTNATMHGAVDVIVCANNATKEDIDKISDLVKAQSADTVIIEESEDGKLSHRNTAGIHQNGYKYFTCLDNKTPHVIVYSNTSEVISVVEGCPSEENDIHFVSTQSARLSNVPFTIIGGSAALIEPEDLDDYLDYSSVFGLDCKGGEN